jgi:hypothetical protein
MKPSVYIETTITSYLAARPNNDMRAMANKNATQEWWDKRRQSFDVFVSEFVIAEATQGNQTASARRIELIKDIPELETTVAARTLAAALISEGPIPQNAEVDAYHIAVATVNGMDYLLTWNCTHIANAIMRPKLEMVCRKLGYEPPVICTPLELMEV